MKKILVSAFLFIFLLPMFLTSLAQNINVQEKFFKAEVVEVKEEGVQRVNDVENPFQVVVIRFLDGDRKGQKEEIDHGKGLSVSKSQLVTKGDKVVIAELTDDSGNVAYHIRDKYRLDSILDILILFVILVVVVAGLKGFGSLLGLGVSLVVIVKFIVPKILEGWDPIFVSIMGSIFILIVTIYLSHGFSRKTTVSVISTAISLIVTGILSLTFVSFAKLAGMGDENAMQLQFGQTSDINLRGLLLGGMIIGALGVLDDVTTTQSAAVFEIKRANSALVFSQLYKRAFTIGKEHIASVVNTLVLAYAGASLSIFIFLILNPLNYPYWVILNTEFFAEEIVRTLAGSFGLILAVPITCAVASFVAVKDKRV